MSVLVIFGLSLLAIFLVFGVAFAWVVRLASDDEASFTEEN